MNFIPVPKFPCPPEDLKAFRDLLNIPRNIIMIPNANLIGDISVGNQWEELKTWRDNQAEWRAEESLAHYYLDPAGFYTLSYRERVEDAGITIKDVLGLSALEAGGYSAKAVQFYSERVLADKGGPFTFVPRIYLMTTSRARAGKLNIKGVGGPAVRWPIAIPTGDPVTPTTLNPEVAFRFNPISNWPEAFLIDDYNREFPIGAVAPTRPPLADLELVSIMMDILEGSMSVAEKAAAIRRLAGR